MKRLCNLYRFSKIFPMLQVLLGREFFRGSQFGQLALQGIQEYFADNYRRVNLPLETLQSVANWNLAFLSVETPIPSLSHCPLFTPYWLLAIKSLITKGLLPIQGPRILQCVILSYLISMRKGAIKRLYWNKLSNDCTFPIIRTD